MLPTYVLVLMICLAGRSLKLPQYTMIIALAAAIFSVLFLPLAAAIFFGGKHNWFICLLNGV